MENSDNRPETIFFGYTFFFVFFFNFLGYWMLFGRESPVRLLGSRASFDFFFNFILFFLCLLHCKYFFYYFTVKPNVVNCCKGVK